MWCCLILGLLTAEGRAYYHPGDRPEPLFFQKERAYARPGDGERSFVIYDNFTSPLGKHQQGPVIYPGSVDFVPADVISINLPLRIAIRYPQTMENSLSNLLYANLKLRGLIEKYRALQQRSRELLAEHAGPIKGASLPTFHQQTWRERSVFKQKEELEMEYLALKKSATPSGTSKGNTELTMLVSTESLVLLLNESTKTEGTPLSLLVQPEGEREKNRTVDGEASKYEVGDKLQSVYHQKPELPWLFQSIFNGLRYLLSHWIETLIYAGILLLFLFGIWVIRPR